MTAKIMMMFACITFAFLLGVIQSPVVSSLGWDTGNETSKTGETGEEVHYFLQVTNDNVYPVDIKAVIDDSGWDAALECDEIIRVLPGEKVGFSVTIRIPEDPANTSSDTNVSFYERPSANGIMGYIRELEIRLRTSVSDPGNRHKHENAFQEFDLSRQGTVLLILAVVLVVCIIPSLHYYRRGVQHERWESRK